MNIRISVIVPVYKYAENIEELLEKISEQTLKEKEVIIVGLEVQEELLKKINEDLHLEYPVYLLEQNDVMNNRFTETVHGKYVIVWNPELSYKEDALERLADRVEEQNYPDACISNGRQNEENLLAWKEPAQLLELAEISQRCVLLKKEIAVQAQWDFKSSETVLTGLALAYAERISICEDKLTEKSRDVQFSARDFYRDALEIRNELKHRSHFEKIEKDYTNVILHYYINMMESLSDKEQFIQNYWKSEFYELGIGGHTRGYFYDLHDFEKLLEILDNSPETVWEKQNLRKVRKQLPDVVDLKDWKPEIKKSDLEMPKITVIIPFYNVERYIEACMESVINQSFHNLEILCVDDGSTDGSADIIKEFAQKDSRIQIIKQKNGGASAARNRGLAAATGKYIYFLDSDDILKEKTLEYCVYMAEDQNLDMVLFSAEEFYENESVKKEKKEYFGYYNRYGDYSGLMTGKNFFEKAVLYGEYKPAVYLYFTKKEIFDQKNLRFIEGIVCEDNIFTFQCLTAARRVRYVNGNFYRRRLRESSVMTGSDGLRLAYSYYTVLKSLEQYSEEEQYDQEYCEILLKQMERMRDNACKAIWNVEMKDAEDRMLQKSEREWMDFYFYVYSVKNIKESSEKRVRDLKKTVENEKMEKLKSMFQEGKLEEALKLEKQKVFQSKEKLQKLEEEYNSLQRKYEKQKEKTMRLSQSWSYKIGRAITWIPRKIKNIKK